MRTEIIILIIGMTLVTYIPRALPALLVGKIAFHPKFEKFLRLIPYTAMAALIFPGILTANTTRPYISIISGSIAALLAYKKIPVMLYVLAAIAVEMIFYIFLPQ